jgi:hypothetical protein
MDASQTHDYCVAKYATHRAAHPDPSLPNERLLGMTVKLSHYQIQIRLPEQAILGGLSHRDGGKSMLRQLRVF